ATWRMSGNGIIGVSCSLKRVNVLRKNSKFIDHVNFYANKSVNYIVNWEFLPQGTVKKVKKKNRFRLSPHGNKRNIKSIILWFATQCWTVHVFVTKVSDLIKCCKVFTYFLRYYYDVNANECKVFIYGGCGGNQNRFQTHSLCMERCTEDE
ncbi:hypothetical protein HF086_001737, partial [Spodoptera exigua]